MAFPPRDFYTVIDLAARWDCGHLQILDWAMSDRLELRIPVSDAEFEDGSEASFAIVPSASVRPLFRAYGEAERHVHIRRARPVGCGKLVRIVEPASGLKIVATDVLVTAAEIERFEEAHGLVRRVVAGPGAPSRYDWDGFYVELIHRVHTEGLPAKQKELTDHMQDWFLSSSQDGEAPDESTIRKKIKAVFQRLRPDQA